MNEYTDSLRGFGGNLVQQKRKSPPHRPWHCPQCNKGVAAHWNQCPDCLQPRVNSYGEEPETFTGPETEFGTLSFTPDA